MLELYSARTSNTLERFGVPHNKSANKYFLRLMLKRTLIIFAIVTRGLRVKKRSQFSHFKDRDTGKWSVNVDANGARRVTVRTDCIAGSLFANSYSHRLVLSNRRWFLTRTKLTEVS